MVEGFRSRLPAADSLHARSSGSLYDVPLETSPATGTEMTEVAVVVKPVEPTEAVPTKTALSKPTAVEIPLAAKDVFEVQPE